MTELQTRFTTEGLVIKEMKIGESDRLVTLFTREYGLIRAFAAGAKNIKSKKASATSLLTYSSFTILRKKDTYRIYEAVPISNFFSLGTDIESLTISQYFCELALEFGQEGTPNNQLLRLILNSLHFLVKEKRDPYLIKAITELRTAVICGYSPNLIACKECGEYETDIMFFNVTDGTIFCEKCKKNNMEIIIDLTTVTAMRHIVFSKFEKLYSFEIPTSSSKKLSQITEQYLTYQIDHKFHSLEFLNSIKE